jgi:hypothetical protein
VILVSGNGGILAHHGTLVVSPHQAEPGPAGSGTRTAWPRTAGASRSEAAADRQEPAVPGGDSGVAAGPARPDNGSGQPALAGPDDFGVVRADPRGVPFFEAANRGELLIRRCLRCDGWLAPSASGCAACGEDAELAWAVASGRGTLVSWSVVHPRHGGPVAVAALVELAEGPWLATGLRLAEAAELAGLHSGQPVAAEFIRPADGASYPVFCSVGTPA